MSLTTYTELKSAVADFLNRDDLTATIPDFITLCEAELNRRLKTRRSVGRSDASLTSQYIAVPTDFGGPRAIILSGTNPKTLLQYVEPVEALELQNTTYPTAGQPRVYTVIGGEFQFLPAPDSTYTLEMTYWKRLSALSGSVASNWVLADHPDAYLYGSLLQAAPYLIDDERVGMWATLFNAIISSIQMEDMQASFGGRLTIRAKSFG